MGQLLNSANFRWLFKIAGTCFYRFVWCAFSDKKAFSWYSFYWACQRIFWDRFFNFFRTSWSLCLLFWSPYSHCWMRIGWKDLIDPTIVKSGPIFASFSVCYRWIVQQLWLFLPIFSISFCLDDGAIIFSIFYRSKSLTNEGNSNGGYDRIKPFWLLNFELPTLFYAGAFFSNILRLSQVPLLRLADCDNIFNDYRLLFSPTERCPTIKTLRS